LGIKRRNFIKGLSGSVVGSLLKINPVSAKNNYDVAIIGAGLAGLGAGGTYVAWQPYQIKKYSNTISDPIPPLFLAGEYSAKTDRGMEGAMESGERAANEVIHYLGVS
tara:strand:+ start:4703 stop:5026 length:324 start_codon:yes stop_codon:yes gene_type:complete